MIKAQGLLRWSQSSFVAWNQTDIFRHAALCCTNRVVFPSQSVWLCSPTAAQLFHTVKGFVERISTVNKSLMLWTQELIHSDRFLITDPCFFVQSLLCVERRQAVFPWPAQLTMSKAVSGCRDRLVSQITGHEWPLVLTQQWKIVTSFCPVKKTARTKSRMGESTGISRCLDHLKVE